MTTALRQTAAGLLTLGMALTMSAMEAADRPAAQPEPHITTIVGCLVQGNPAPDASDAAKADEFFVRTPTVTLPVGTTVAVGKPGTLSTATSAGTPAPDSYYRITGMASLQLRPHIGHRVELQGHLSARKADAAAGGITSTETTVDAAGKPRVTVETRMTVAGDLQATTLKMVSPTCE